MFLEVGKELFAILRQGIVAPWYAVSLFYDMIFLEDTVVVQAIQEGTYIFPLDTGLATKLLVEEDAHTYLRRVNSHSRYKDIGSSLLAFISRYRLRISFCLYGYS